MKKKEVKKNKLMKRRKYVFKRGFKIYEKEYLLKNKSRF
jgi:hypothetical protein